MLVLALALIAAGCSDYRGLDDRTAVALTDPEKRHPIGFSTRTEGLEVEVPRGADGLSPNQEADVLRFLERYRRESEGRLTLSTPASSRDNAAVQRSLRDVQALVAEAGVDYRLVSGQRGHRSAGVAAIRLSYQRPVAVPPHCEHWSENLAGRNEERVPYPNWGCATQHNLAVMVDNARDLTRPQAEDPRSGERRSLSWSAYAGSAGGGGDNASAAAKRGGSTGAGNGGATTTKQ